MIALATTSPTVRIFPRPGPVPPAGPGLFFLQTVCMYCDTELRRTAVARRELAGVSHGVCRPCYGREVAPQIEALRCARSS